MPQLTLEYTANVRVTAGLDELAGRLHEVLASVGGIRLENCKTRWQRLDGFAIGDGAPGRASSTSRSQEEYQESGSVRARPV